MADNDKPFLEQLLIPRCLNIKTYIVCLSIFMLVLIIILCINFVRLHTQFITAVLVFILLSANIYLTYLTIVMPKPIACHT